MPLRISLLLNLVLLGCVAFLLISGPYARRGDVMLYHAFSELEIGRSGPGELPTKARVNPRTSTFHWSQLESTDFPTYIANLRGIGCPDQTLHDIISADLHSLYALQLKELEEQLAGYSKQTRREADADVRRLRAEEIATLAVLLGNQSQTTQSSYSPFDGDAVPSFEADDSEAPLATMPLVFQSIDFDALGLDPDQAGAITHLRERFLKDIGGGNQDPTDKGYSERWLRSQPAIDDDLRGMIGVNAYQDLELRARSKASGFAGVQD